MNDFGLCPYRDTTFEAMSLGTQKKFLLLAAWMAGPQVLLLDEPSEGLDLAARQLLEDLVKKTSERSVVLFSSHDIDFIERSGASVICMESMFGDNG